MSNTITITTLVENTVNIAGLQAEHGLSFLIRTGGNHVLFDTGQSDLLVSNAAKMGLSLEKVQAVILSHGHYDHTGGLEALLQVAPRTKAFCHPAALQPKFITNADGTSRSIGMAHGPRQQLLTSGRLELCGGAPTEVIPGIFATGEIPRRNAFEDTGGPFFLDATSTQPDPLADDQAVYFDTHKGLVVLLGCAHSGAINTLDYVRELAPGRPLWMVLGGMHLLSAGTERMQKTLEALRRLAPKRILTAHCTGSQAFARLSAAFPDMCSTCPVGTSLVLEGRHR